MTLRKSRFWSLLLAYVFFLAALGMPPVVYVPDAGAATQSILPYPRFKAFVTGTSTPLAGGKLYTYLPGTTTPTSTYTTSAGTVANANPVVLDANGEADVWFTGTIKLILTDSDDVTIWTKDNVRTLGNIVGDGTGERISGYNVGSASYTDNGYFDAVLSNDLITRGPWVDARAYGVVCDSVTDDAAAINAAIVAAGRKPVVLPVGNCVTKSPITLKDGTRLHGAQKSSSDVITGGTNIIHTSASLDNVFTVGNPNAGRTYTYDIEVSNIGVTGNSNTNAIFNLFRVANSSFRDLTLYNGKYAFWITLGMANTYERTYCGLQSETSVVIGTTNDTTTQTFKDMYFSRSKYAFDFQVYSVRTVIDTVIIESMTLGGINVYWGGGYTGISIDKLHTESIPDNVIRIGVDGVRTGGAPHVTMANSSIYSTNTPIAGNAIYVSGVESLYLAGNFFDSWDNVVYANGATISNGMTVMGNNTEAANNRVFSASTNMAKVYGFNNYGRMYGTYLTMGTGTKTILDHFYGYASLDFTALAANTCETLNITVAGASAGNVVSLGLPWGLIGVSDSTVFTGWVSDDNTVSVKRCNVGGTTTSNPAAAGVSVNLWKY